MRSDYHGDPLLEEQFLKYVMVALQLPSAPSMGTRLYEDLTLDSLAVYELLVAIEDLGVEVSEEQWARTATIGDCYHAYRTTLAPTTQR